MKTPALFLALVLAVVAAYSNHFGNAFEFDDAHTVVDNAYIRDLGHVGQMFTDVRTATANPANQIYRPLVTVSLAVDYALGHGLVPFWFHLSTFLWFLALLALLYLLFESVVGRGARVIALFAVAWFGLHPAIAETINYVYQRGEVFAALGIVGCLVVYARFPALRRSGLYLLPALVGMLAKQTALMFAPLLLLYILLFETSAWRVALRRAAPAFVLAGIYYVFQHQMTAASWESGGSSTLHYWYTQPIVILHYALSLLAPTQLTVDTDRGLVTSLASHDVLLGVAFLVAVAAVAIRCVRRPELRPIAFGLAWFLITLAPSSLLPFAEVENDHRMFLPFIGLVLAVSYGVALAIRARPRLVRVAPAAAIAVLIACGIGTHLRNEVWHTPESLWCDATHKSPRNGRAIMNYGLALMARGDYRGALARFTEAQQYTPDYFVLYINLGIAHGGAGHPADAEHMFRRAISLAPDRADPPFFFARWLASQHRQPEAIALLRGAIQLNPDLLQASQLLMTLEAERGDSAALVRTARATHARFPHDEVSQRYLHGAVNVE